VKAVRLIIMGRPRTKKTSANVAVNRKTGRRFPVASKYTKDWTSLAQRQMRLQYTGPLLTGPVIVNYRIYRGANMGDLGGFEAAIDDAMEGCVYKNDKQIIGRATLKLVDRENPRVEILVTAATAEQMAASGEMAVAA
jgi:Holliday junction resolvase RusA-like endonuclease